MNGAVSAEFKKILVIQLRQMGDVLLCTPALRALRKKFPASKLAFLVDSRFEPLLRLNPDLDVVLTRNAVQSVEAVGTIRRVRRFAPDLVIDYLANPRTAIISLLSGAKATLSYSNKRRSFVYSIKANPSGEYVAEEKLSLLKPLGIEGGGLDLVFNLPESADRRIDQIFSGSGIGANEFVVALDLFHKRPARQWPAENFMEVADRLVEKYSAKVIITCVPKNRIRAEQALAKARQRHWIAPDLDLFELAALIKRAKLFLGADAGTKHIAVSQRTPSFTFLGPSGLQWTPSSLIHQAGFVELDCRPCAEHECPKPGHPCQTMLTVDLAWEKLANFLASLKP